MIGRTHRFHGYNSLKFVYQHGKTIRGAFMSLRFAQNDRRKAFRVAVVVSKKVSKSAVVRNRIRRRIYEVIRLQADQIVGTPDIVVTVFNQTVADMPHNDLQNHITSLFVQAKLVNGEKNRGGRDIIEQKEN